MYINVENYKTIQQECNAKKVTLVAVSKTKPIAAIEELYALGHRHFGENYVQELLEKQAALPKDIHWHFIGHLQSNKAKYIVPFVHLIHGVDSVKLLQSIDKEAKKQNRIIDCLLQMHIATEETKFGMSSAEIQNVLQQKEEFPHTAIKGLMGMASFTENQEQIKSEFNSIVNVFNTYKSATFATLSIGMSGDYQLAIAEGSNMVRVGSLIFGKR